MPRKLAKTMRIFVEIDNIENRRVTFWPKRIGPVFPMLWSGHEFSHDHTHSCWVSHTFWPPASTTHPTLWILFALFLGIPRHCYSTFGTTFHNFGSLQLVFNMGTVKPAVFPKWVPWVWVQSRFLAHHNTPHTHTMVLWVFTGLCIYVWDLFFLF